MLSTPRIGIPFDPAGNKRQLGKLKFYEYAVRQAGGEPIVLATSDPPLCTLQAASTLDGVLLPGSPADVDPALYHAARQAKCAESDPASEQTDYSLLEAAYAEHKPLLAICYGVQILNVYRSGTLIQHIDGHEGGERHAVSWAAGSILAELAGGEAATVNSYHHQAIERIGRGLRVVARAGEVIEAVEGEEPMHFVLGVQWHPERDFDSSAFSQEIFKRFIEAARQRTGSG